MAKQVNGQVNLRRIPLDEIHSSPAALRVVDRENQEYREMVDSVRNKGVLNAISVRKVKDRETGKEFYSIVDGLQRYTASVDAGLSDIPAQIFDMDEASLYEAQIIANANRVTTKPIEFAKGIQRLFIANPTLTLSEVSAKVFKSPSWVQKQMGLLKIKDEKIRELVNDGKIKLSNAWDLSNLPEEEQANFVDRAMTESPETFRQLATERNRQIRAAKRQGKTATPEEFVATPKLRKLKELNLETENLSVGKEIIRQYNLTDPLTVWKWCLDYVRHMDPKSVETRKVQEDERKQRHAEEKKKAAAERAAKKAEEAARMAAMVS